MVADNTFLDTTTIDIHDNADNSAMKATQLTVFYKISIAMY